MRHFSCLRFVTALVTLFCLLFAQAALAAYACPKLALPAQAAQAVAPDGHAMPCPKLDKQSPNLCQAHGQSKAQAPDQGAQPPVAAFIPARLLTELAALEHPLPVHLEAPASFLQAGGCAPPITIRHCRFLN